MAYECILYELADRVATIMSQTPMNRFGNPEELVGAALLLLSPVAGSFVTGTELYVDGGFNTTALGLDE